MTRSESPTLHQPPTAVVTGASRGLGAALTDALVRRGWQVVVDGRDRVALARRVRTFAVPGAVTAVTGDVSDPAHRQELSAAAADVCGPDGALALLVNNASRLGPSPQPVLADYPLAELQRVYATNVVAPLATFQLLRPLLRRGGGRVVNVSSDAAVEPYEGWGGYGSSKAALDQLTVILGAENPDLRVYAFDPGDMATDMQQRAFPSEDVSDRPAPSTVVPALLRLVDGYHPSGRYRGADIGTPTIEASQ